MDHGWWCPARRHIDFCEQAVKWGAELICIIGADQVHPPDLLPRLYKRFQEGYDIVCGSRYMKGGKRIGGSKTKAFFSLFVGKSLHYLLRLPTYDISNAFKMYRKQVIDRVDFTSNSFEVSMEIALKAYYLGFKITDVPTVWKARSRGKSSFSWDEIADALAFWFNRLPSPCLAIFHDMA